MQRNQVGNESTALTRPYELKDERVTNFKSAQLPVWRRVGSEPPSYGLVSSVSTQQAGNAR